MRKRRRLTAVDGDVMLPCCGLSAKVLDGIAQSTSTIIHAASTLSLVAPLKVIAGQVIDPSIMMSQLALSSFPKLEQFVFVSTAFATLWMQRDSRGALLGPVDSVKEDICGLRADVFATLDCELSDIKNHGTTPEYEFGDCVTSYTYAKNLTERYLYRQFRESGMLGKLLIFRPSLFSPAEQFPTPMFQKMDSCPSNLWYAFLIGSPPTKIEFVNYLANSDSASIDEIPIDIAVNRLLAHLASGTCGVVHATAGQQYQSSVNYLWRYVTGWRRGWLGRPSISWRKGSWNAPDLTGMSRVFNATGTSIQFENTKTECLWEQMTKGERLAWPLWITETINTPEKLELRRIDLIKAVQARLREKSRLKYYASKLWIK